jgi:hypothetical protein
MASTTHTTREEAAEAAYLRAYGAHDEATEEERAWGLKCSSEDALLAMLGVLYPEVYAGTGAAGIYSIRASQPLSQCAESLWEEESEGLTAAEIVSRTIAGIDEAMVPTLLEQAAALGVDVEVERFDPYFLACALWEITRLPERERASAVAAVNDGATPDARHLYRQEG